MKRLLFDWLVLLLAWAVFALAMYLYCRALAAPAPAPRPRKAARPPEGRYRWSAYTLQLCEGGGYWAWPAGGSYYYVGTWRRRPDGRIEIEERLAGNGLGNEPTFTFTVAPSELERLE